MENQNEELPFAEPQEPETVCFSVSRGGIQFNVQSDRKTFVKATPAGVVCSIDFDIGYFEGEIERYGSRYTGTSTVKAPDTFNMKTGIDLAIRSSKNQMKSRFMHVLAKGKRNTLKLLNSGKEMKKRDIRLSEGNNIILQFLGEQMKGLIEYAFPGNNLPDWSIKLPNLFYISRFENKNVNIGRFRIIPQMAKRVIRMAVLCGYWPIQHPDKIKSQTLGEAFIPLFSEAHFRSIWKKTVDELKRANASKIEAAKTSGSDKMKEIQS